MTKLNQKSNSKNSTGQDDASECDLSVNPAFLLKRLNALIIHAGDIDGEKTGDGNAKEIAVHIKNLKDLQAYNDALKMAKPEGKPKYSPEQKMAMAEKLADILIRNGGSQ